MSKILIKIQLFLMVFLAIYCINRLFFEIEFWNDQIAVFFLLMFIFVCIVLIINSVRIFKKNKILALSSLLILLISVSLQFLQYISCNYEHDDRLIFNDKRVVDVYFDPIDDIYFFVQKDKVSHLFSKQKCIYWLRISPLYKWNKYDDSTLLIYDDSSEGIFIVLNDDFSSDDWSCYNDFNVELKLCGK